MSLVLPPATRVTPPAGNGFGPLAVSTDHWITASLSPGTPTRKIARPSIGTPAMTCSRAGGACGTTSSPPRETSPSTQVSLRTAATWPPRAVTWPTGDGSDSAMASSRITVRPYPATTRPWPLGDSIRPLAPKTLTSTVTGFGPGLARTRCSRRPGAAPPAMSHDDPAPGIQADVTKPRLVPFVVKDHCVATVPGAIAPAPATSADRGVET